MSTDVLILGGVIFDDWSTPEKLPFGGRQGLVVHKLPGGNRVVDTLGPDEADLQFSATLWGETAYTDALTLNGMRQSGEPIPLSFAGQFYLVILQECNLKIERFPQFCTYSLSCLIVQNSMSGSGGATVSTFGDLVMSDLATALHVAGL